MKINEVQELQEKIKQYDELLNNKSYEMNDIIDCIDDILDCIDEHEECLETTAEILSKLEANYKTLNQTFIEQSQSFKSFKRVTTTAIQEIEHQSTLLEAKVKTLDKFQNINILITIVLIVICLLTIN